MTDVVATPQELVADNAATSADARFYVVSKRKFTVLFFATLGMYEFYWFYKQWSCYKDGTAFESDEHDVWPFVRAVFAIFFVHSLFRRVKQHSQAGSELDRWEDRTHAFFLVLFILIDNTLDRLSLKAIGSPYTDVASLVMLAPLFFFFYKAQTLINTSCGDPEGTANSKFTPANYAWIVIGGILWVLLLLGLLLPSES